MATTRRVCSVLGGLLIAAATPGLAQSTDEGMRALAIPRAPSLRCRSIPPSMRTESDTAASHVFQFELGHEFADSRSIVALFDAAGSPITLRENVVVTDSAGRIVIDGIVVEFIRGQVLGFISHGDDRATRKRGQADSLDLSGPNPLITPLNETQKRAATEVMKWLWAHRCGQRSRGT